MYIEKYSTLVENTVANCFSAVDNTTKPRESLWKTHGDACG
jgi:hypothetical protein